MILKALADYYERMLNDPDCDVARPGFEKKAIPFLIVINKQGLFVNLRDTRTGDRKKKDAREFFVPQGEKKTSGIKANLFWDNPQYVLGAPKIGCQDESDLQRAEDSLLAFKNRIDRLPDDCADCEGVRAIQIFLSSILSGEDQVFGVFKHELWPEIWQSNANLSFMLEGEDNLIAQNRQIVKCITTSLGKEENLRTCAVTGGKDITAELHTSIKGVWGAQSSGANIVSFNLDAFRSFGKKQGLNAPIGKKTVFAYSTALNTMLSKGSRQRIQVGDASTVFWAKENHPFEDDFSCFLGEPSKGEEPDYGRMRSLLTSVRTGVLPPEDMMPFYVLGLAPNASRISIRFWYKGNVREVKERISQHFEDIEIIRGPHDREFLSLFQLMVSTATEGKADNIPPSLGSGIAWAVLGGREYPRTLFSGAIRRCKAEQRITHARAAIIKGFLVRESRLKGINKKEEVGMALDKTIDNTGYVLGRLFAVLERIQEQAHTGLNKTIRDTYFSAATSNPLVIFKRLQDLAIHHLAKIRNSGKSTVWLDKLMGEVMGKIPASGIPVTLTLEDQGRFAVGYYHQRQDFFNTKENETKENNNE
jgi:CRISPR-associated protein Csd1